MEVEVSYTNSFLTSRIGHPSSWVLNERVLSCVGEAKLFVGCSPSILEGFESFHFLHS